MEVECEWNLNGFCGVLADNPDGSAVPPAGIQRVDWRRDLYPDHDPLAVLSGQENVVQLKRADGEFPVTSCAKPRKEAISAYSLIANHSSKQKIVPRAMPLIAKDYSKNVVKMLMLSSVIVPPGKMRRAPAFDERDPARNETAQAAGLGAALWPADHFHSGEGAQDVGQRPSEIGRAHV